MNRMRSTARLCRYFFRALDVESVGRLSPTVVSMWCRHVVHVAVHELTVAHDELQPDDLKDEIFDMIMPAKPALGFTFDELMAVEAHSARSNMFKHSVCAVLVDAQCLYEYEQREHQALAQSEDM